MLSAIRNRTQSFVVKILAALLIGSFAIWGVEDMFNVVTSKNSAIFEIGDIEGESTAIENAVYREINNLRQMLGNNFGTDEAKALGIVDLVLQRQIDDSAFLIAAHKLGVEISDNLVRREIQQNEAFKGIVGFDKDRFKQILSNNFISEATYISNTRSQISRNQLLDSLSSDTFPEETAKTFYKHRQQKRTIETVFVSDNFQQGVTDANQMELIKFHKDNAPQFTAPEYRAVSVVQLKATDLSAEILVTNEELMEDYEAREDEFTKNEFRHVKQMIFSEQKLAQKASNSLSQGQDFTKVAKEIAKMDAEAIDLGKITYTQLPFPELADIVFGLKIGENSSIQKSTLGWHLFRVDEIDLGGVKTFDEVKGELRKTIAHEKAVDSLYELANKLEDTLGGGVSIEEAAGQLNLKVLKITSIDNKGKDKNGNIVKSIPVGNFLDITFATNEGSESPISETGDDGYFVLRVDSITAPELRPLATIKTKVNKAWKASRRAEKSKLSAKKIVERVNSGKPLSVISSEMGLKLNLISKLDRSPERGKEKIPNLLINKIFELSINKSSMARNGEGYTVASLKEIIVANPSSDKNGVDELTNQLSESLGRDIHAQLAMALRERFGVKINNEAVSSLFTGAASSRRR
jgi:peptidyl-prolyl cis-trans isomerase D